MRFVNVEKNWRGPNIIPIYPRYVVNSPYVICSPMTERPPKPQIICEDIPIRRLTTGNIVSEVMFTLRFALKSLSEYL